MTYDATLVNPRLVCDDAVVHLDQVEHRGLPVLLADDRDGMAFLAQLDSSLVLVPYLPSPIAILLQIAQAFSA